MATYEDLSPYSYYPGEEDALSVGWLGSDSPFSQGEVDEGVLSRIAWLCLNEPVVQTRGIHACEFCRYQDDVECYLLIDGAKPHLLGSNEIRVPGDGVTYAAPSLVLHYLVDHGYRPPDEFLRAVESLPNRLPEGWQVKRLPWEQVKLLHKQAGA